ncbi:MAG: tripartite tricarboxylate transporter substrate-binding protein [Alphaproteobacteria bacterium]
MIIDRRHLLATGSALALSSALAGFARDAKAQAVDVLQIFVPANPGGGWDQTGRSIEQVMRQEKLINTAQVTNVGGAGGAVGLPQFLNQWRGRPNALMVAGMVMVGSLIANKSPVKMTQTVPIARLTGEFLVVAVPAASPFKTARDFAQALKADTSKVPIAGGSAGGSDHILAGMIARAVGAEAKQVSYVAYSGGGPALAALIGAQVAAGISGYGEFSEQIKAGKLRALAISADQRQPGIDVPTLKEQGINVELFNWRGVFAPPGITDQQRRDITALVEKMVASASWKAECEKRDWTSIPLMGDAYATFITEEITRIEGILKELGLAA